VAVAIIWALNRADGDVVSDGSEPPVTDVPSASPDTAGWGPLAVEEPDGAIMEARISGRLSITDDCVFLVPLDGTDVLLLWPSDRTFWDELNRTITFVNTDGSSIDLRDGMSLRTGGGGFAEAEADISIEEWLDQRSWVSAPADGCALSEAWVIGSGLEAE